MSFLSASLNDAPPPGHYIQSYQIFSQSVYKILQMLHSQSGFFNSQCFRPLDMINRKTEFAVQIIFIKSYLDFLAEFDYNQCNVHRPLMAIAAIPRISRRMRGPALPDIRTVKLVIKKGFLWHGWQDRAGYVCLQPFFVLILKANPF